MENNSNLRPQIVLSVIILILAVIMLAQTFIPRQPRLITPSNGGGQAPGGQVSPSNKGYVGASASLVIPELAL